MRLDISFIRVCTLVSSVDSAKYAPIASLQAAVFSSLLGVSSVALTAIISREYLALSSVLDTLTFVLSVAEPNLRVAP